MRIEFDNEGEKIHISPHSDAEDIITIEQTGRHYYIGINKKYKDEIEVNEFEVGKI